MHATKRLLVARVLLSFVAALEIVGFLVTNIRSGEPNAVGFDGMFPVSCHVFTACAH